MQIIQSFRIVLFCHGSSHQIHPPQSETLTYTRTHTHPALTHRLAKRSSYTKTWPSNRLTSNVLRQPRQSITSHRTLSLYQGNQSHRIEYRENQSINPRQVGVYMDIARRRGVGMPSAKLLDRFSTQKRYFIAPGTNFQNMLRKFI